jgi:hypothetical protein
MVVARSRWMPSGKVFPTQDDDKQNDGQTRENRMKANLRKPDDGNRSPKKVKVRVIPGKEKVINMKTR